MIKLEQAKQLIDSMDETERIMMLSLLLETIWVEETDVGDSIHNLVNEKTLLLLENDFTSKANNAEVIDLKEYKDRKIGRSSS